MSNNINDTGMPDGDTPVLAFEGGATHTKAAVVTADAAAAVCEAGPCNPTAYGVAASARALIEAGTLALAAHSGAAPRVAAIGSAGAVEDAQRRALGEAVCAHFGLERAIVATDLHPLLLANAWDKPGILAIAGTGSNVLGRDASGRLVQVGGRGTLLGDDGSGYMIASEALRRAARARDGWGPATTLVEALPRAAKLAAFDGLISWGAAATKRDIAALCQAVFACADAGDAVARACVVEEAGLLAEQVLAAAAQLGGVMAGLETVFGVGGLFERYDLFVTAFNARLQQSSRLRFAAPQVTGPAAVAVLARLSPAPTWAVEVLGAQTGLPAPVSREETGKIAALAATEGIPETPALDSLSPDGIVRAMFAAEAGVAACLARNVAEIAALVEAAAAAIRGSGRLIYFGAGTSGRLGVLDASECAPTFGVGAETITARIAGGDVALRHAVEGAEDDADAGAREVAEERVSEKDLVIGIAASGGTPYVRGALAAARARGARTGLVCCVAQPAISADMVVALDTGAEALPGSTRLKAGTATKIVLNTISTGAMALTGRVFEGRMVAMRASNVKLRARAARMVAELAGVDVGRAEGLLAAAGWDIRVAIVSVKLGASISEAQQLLELYGGGIQPALQQGGAVG